MALLSCVAFVAPTIAQDKPAAPPAPIPQKDASNPLRGDEITEKQKQAVTRGLEALSNLQDRNGAFGGAGTGPHVAMTSLAALAFMQAGNLPGRGQYGDVVDRATNFVLANCQESGLITANNDGSPMYGHGFATLFLAEVYGMTGDERVKEKLQKAIRLIAKSQNAEGGWRYQPAPNDADISVTICQVMALRAARDAGIKVEKETIDNAILYVKKCQNQDGGFSYMANSGGGFGGGLSGSGFARSGAGVAALFYAGIYEGKEINRGMDYLRKFVPGKKGGRAGNDDGNYFYGQYYAVQAMFLAGGTDWAAWYPAIREELISRQNANGLWQGEQSDHYATAMALIVLQMPNRYLPVYTGKGPGS